MNLLLGFFAFAYIAALTLLKPAPFSLHDKPETRRQTVTTVKGSLGLGLVLLAVFALTYDAQLGQLSPDVVLDYALDNTQKTVAAWAKKLLGHSFLHFNVLHLASNVVGIGLASLYERRVGTTRFLTVYAIGSAVSALSIFAYNDADYSVGASGGLFALAAAYFIDFGRLTLKQWLTGLLICTFVLVAFSLYGAVQTRSNAATLFDVDYIAHAIGAISAIIFVALRPHRGRRLNPTNHQA